MILFEVIRDWLIRRKVRKIAKMESTFWEDHYESDLEAHYNRDNAPMVPPRQIISLKKQPTPEEIIYEFVTTYKGKVNREESDSLDYRYTVKRNGEQISLTRRFNGGYILYNISFSFEHEFKFDKNEVADMYDCLARAHTIYEAGEEERKRLARLAKDEAKRKAFLGTGPQVTRGNMRRA